MFRSDLEAKKWYARYFDAVQYARSPEDIFHFEISYATEALKKVLKDKMLNVSTMSKADQDFMVVMCQTMPDPKGCVFDIRASESQVVMKVSNTRWMAIFTFQVEGEQLLLSKDIEWEAIDEEDNEK